MNSVVSSPDHQPTGAAALQGGAARRQSRPSRRALYAALPIVVFVIIAVAWELAARSMRSLLFPSFTGTVRATLQMLGDHDFQVALWTSNQAFLLGLAISLIVGIPLGIIMGRFRTVERVVNPYLDIALTTPTAAIIPFLILFVGTGLEMRTAVVVLFAIPYVIVNSRAGVRQVDPTLIEMATSFGARERQIWRRILLPGALPAVMTGVRLGLSRAFTGMVLVELLGGGAGIGLLMLRFQGFFQPDNLYATVVLMIIEALVLIQVVARFERRLVPWARSTSLDRPA